VELLVEREEGAFLPGPELLLRVDDLSAAAYVLRGRGLGEPAGRVPLEQ